MNSLPLFCSTGILLLSTISGCVSTADAEANTSPEIDSVTVDYVVDGDTIRAMVDGQSERIRLLGIDTPELGSDGHPEERCAREAT